MKVKRLIVTGIHRSGSTWMGKILGLSRELQYIHEPFNLKKHPNSPLSFWYQYFTVNSVNEDIKVLKHYLDSFQKVNLTRLFTSVKRAKYLGQVRDSIMYEFKCVFSKPLYKDPIAVLSSEWFYEELDSHVIVSIRHPAAFVASVKVKNWIFDFDNLLQQELLMQDYLKKYKHEMEIANKRKDLIESGILIWNIIYDIVYQLKEKYADNPNWVFVRHEDLSRNPVVMFKQIFNQLNLKFTPKIEAAIVASTRPQKKGYLSRDARQNIYTWRNRLEDSDIAIIKNKTKQVWMHFYTEEDW